MPKLTANGITLHYITVGEGPDVVMLHGFLGNLAVWHLYMVPILRRHFRVTTYDLRGHGYSEMTSAGYSAADMAEDLRCLLDELKIEKPNLVGHSYGADVALYFSLLHPERVDRLAALEPGLAALVEERKCKDWMGWSLWVSKLEEVGLRIPEDKRSDPEYLLQVSLETPRFYGPARGLPRNRGPLLKLIRETTLISDYQVVGELTKDAVSRIETPTLLAYGRNSHFLGSYEFLRRALPNCTPVLLPDAEHFGPLEQPELLTRHMLDFLLSDNSAVTRMPAGELS